MFLLAGWLVLRVNRVSGERLHHKVVHGMYYFIIKYIKYLIAFYYTCTVAVRRAITHDS